MRTSSSSRRASSSLTVTIAVSLFLVAVVFYERIVIEPAVDHEVFRVNTRLEESLKLVLELFELIAGVFHEENVVSILNLGDEVLGLNKFGLTLAHLELPTSRVSLASLASVFLRSNSRKARLSRLGKLPTLRRSFKPWAYFCNDAIFSFLSMYPPIISYLQEQKPRPFAYHLGIGRFSRSKRWPAGRPRSTSA